MLCNFEAEIGVLLGSRGDKRMKAWRNGLRPLKEMKRSSKTSPKGKKRVVAKVNQKATTCRRANGVQRQSDESSQGSHDSSHIYWCKHTSPETKRRVVLNIPWLVAYLLIYANQSRGWRTSRLQLATTRRIFTEVIPQAEQKRRLVTLDVTSRLQHVRCLFRVFWRLIFGATINSGSYFFYQGVSFLVLFSKFPFCSSSLRVFIVEHHCYI